MKPGFGYVYVEIPKEIESIKTASGIEFYVDTKFDPHRYANIYATVIEPPTKLRSKSMIENRERKNHISKDAEVYVKAGDKVFFHYLTLKNAKKNYNRGKYFEEDGKRYAILPYASLFFAVRKGIEETATLERAKIWKDPEHRNIDTAVPQPPKSVADSDRVEITEFIMLNSWVLIEPVAINQHTEKIEKYGSVLIDDERSTEHIAVIADNPFKSSEGVVKACPPEVGLEPGDVIIFERESDVPVEYDLVRTLDKPYFRMELKDIIAKRVGRDVELLQDYCLIIQDEEVKQSEFDMWPEKPSTGEVVQISPIVKKTKVGEHVFFAPGMYTEFPFRDKRIGVLVHEGAILMETDGQKINIV